MPVCKKATSTLGILCLIFVVCMVDALFASDNKTDQQINCDIQHQPCIRTISGGSVFFDIQPKPVKAMEPLKFEVRVKDVDPAGPLVIDLRMPGMEMGPNQVKMKMTAPGVYRGTGIIVRCPSGKTKWQAIVHLPGKGSVDFIFDAVY